jgi:hypothetical protein
MTHKSANPCFINDSSRCQHRTPSRRRCRLRVVDSRSGLCFRHAQLRLQRLEVPDLSSDLLGQLSQFTSAADINQVLSKLLILLAQNRISPRRAAVIAYTTSLLLRTLPAIEHESGADSPTIIWDMPRPLREDARELNVPACVGPPAAGGL